MRTYSRQRDRLFIALLVVFGLMSIWRISRRGTINEGNGVYYANKIDIQNSYRRSSTLLSSNNAFQSITEDTQPFEEESEQTNLPNHQELEASVSLETVRNLESINTAVQLVISKHAPSESDMPNEEDSELYEDLLTRLESVKQKCADMEVERTLYVVPLDPLASLKATDADKYSENVKKMVEELRQSRSYITFRGSDYVFVCITSACHEFLQDFGEQLAGERGTRALLAGIEINTTQISWPCPLRVISLDSADLDDTALLTQKLLQSAAERIVENNRWECVDQDHDAKHLSHYKKSDMFGAVYLEEYNMVMCQIPKSGSTMLMLLLRRMLHKEDWRSMENGLPHHPIRSGVTYVSELSDEALRKRLYEDPSVIKAAIVRHPIPRLLSAYLDKIDGLKEYSRVGHLPEYVKENGHPSFAQFVDFLITTHPDSRVLEQHFLIQSDSCGIRDHDFDFIGHLDELGAEFREFSQSLGFWDAYVATGWGKNQSQPFGVQSYQDDQRHARNKIWQHYTEDLMRKVHEYYKEDFIRFGFTLEEALATKPTTMLS